MFDIYQSPYVEVPNLSADMTVFVRGSVITINGEDFDFSFMGKGDVLPRQAIDSNEFVDDVQCREDGVLVVTLRVPVAPGATGDAAFPAPLQGKKYGKVIDIHIPASQTSAPTGKEAANA